MTDGKTLVADGAQYLDGVYPEWYKEINVVSLNMRDPSECILGQLYEGYYRALDLLSMSQRQAVDYGFDSNSGTYYKALRAAWIAEIDKRQIPEFVIDPKDIVSVPRLATEAVADVMVEGTVTVGGKQIVIPNLPLNTVLALIEANK